MHSLSRRLLISVSVPLALFFGIMMLVLDSSFRALSEQSLQRLLDSQMVALIAAAEPEEGGGYAPSLQAVDARLATPRSGLYAQIRSAKHEWRSPSSAGVDADFGPLLTTISVASASLSTRTTVSRSRAALSSSRTTRPAAAPLRSVWR